MLHQNIWALLYWGISFVFEFPALFFDCQNVRDTMIQSLCTSSACVNGWRLNVTVTSVFSPYFSIFIVYCCSTFFVNFVPYHDDVLGVGGVRIELFVQLYIALHLFKRFFWVKTEYSHTKLLVSEVTSDNGWILANFTFCYLNIMDHLLILFNSVKKSCLSIFSFSILVFVDCL